MLPIVIAVIFFLNTLLGLLLWRALVVRDRNLARSNVALLQANPQATPKTLPRNAWSSTAGLALAAVGFVCMVLTLFASSIAIVGTREVGIVRSFNKPVGHLSAGFHLIAPWESVSEMDGAIQTDVFGDPRGGGNCVTVRVANQQKACASISIQWRIRPGAADELFQNYRTFDHVRSALVTREFQASINAQLASYNPLNSVAGAQKGAPNPTYTQLAARVRDQMRAEVGSRVEVLNVFLPFLGFDDATQKRLNLLQQQIAQTRVAEAEFATNRAQSKANDALGTSLLKNPLVLVDKCLNLIKQGFTPPIGFSCWGASQLSGIIANPSTTTTGR